MSAGVDLEQARETFFRKTRWLALPLYGGFGLGAALFAAAAFADDAGQAAPALAGGFVATVALIGAGIALPVHARFARVIVALSAVAGAVLANVLDVDALGSTAIVMGAIAGMCAGTAAGIALTRRRLRHDDELLRRQMRLGFDPERPWAWLRGR